MKDPLIQQLEQAEKDQEERAEASRKFPIVKISRMEIRQIEWTIFHHMERGSITLIVGPSGAGKSLVALDQGFCIASGIPWRGKKTAPGPVLYICGEGLHGVKRRLLALAQRYQIDLETVLLYIAPGVTLSDPDCMRIVSFAAKDVFHDSAAPKLIIIDTWASALGADENSTADTIAGLSALTTLAKPYGSAVLIVHHTGHGDKGRARGSSALHAAMDAVYLVEKGEDEIVRITNAKAKDFEPPAPMAFKIVPVEIQGLVNDEGKPEQSVILESTDFESDNAPRDASGKWQRVAFDTLRELSRRHRENLEKAGLEPGGAKVSADDWRHACIDAGIPKTRFYEVRRGFIAAGIIAEEFGYVRIK
jgi:RecA-family ATPase